MSESEKWKFSIPTSPADVEEVREFFIRPNVDHTIERGIRGELLKELDGAFIDGKLGVMLGRDDRPKPPHDVRPDHVVG